MRRNNYGLSVSFAAASFVSAGMMAASAPERKQKLVIMAGYEELDLFQKQLLKACIAERGIDSVVLVISGSGHEIEPDAFFQLDAIVINLQDPRISEFVENVHRESPFPTGVNILQKISVRRPNTHLEFDFGYCNKRRIQTPYRNPYSRAKNLTFSKRCRFRVNRR